MVTFAFSRYIFPNEQLLSSGLAILVGLFSIGLVSGLGVLKLRKLADAQTINYLVVVLLLGSMVGYSFLISGPALIDRSLTVYMLSSISNSDSGLSENSLKKIGKYKWWPAVDQVGKRITEQENLGLIERTSEGNYEITPKGRFSVWFFRLIQSVFSLEPSMTRGSYK